MLELCYQPEIMAFVSLAEEIYQLKIRIRIRSLLEVLVLENQAWCSFITLHYEGSFVIHDPSGELFSKSAGYLKQRGYEIKVLNFANPNNSSGYNPLVRAQAHRDIQKVASLLIENALGGKSKDPFWNSQKQHPCLPCLSQSLKNKHPNFKIFSM